jgi:hypothetical protein
MQRIERKKRLTIITAGAPESMLIAAITKRGIGGYAIVQAHGAGASGIQSGMLEGDASILIYVIISDGRLVSVLDDLESLKRGHRLKAVVSDIAVLPRKASGVGAHQSGRDDGSGGAFSTQDIGQGSIERHPESDAPLSGRSSDSNRRETGRGFRSIRRGRT